MYSLSIMFGPANAMWTLMFHDEVKAAEAFQLLNTGDANTVTHLTDDFGQKVYLKQSAIHAAMLEDLDQSKQAHIETALHRARTQARAQTLASNDPILRNAAAMNSPAVFSPMGNGGRFPPG